MASEYTARAGRADRRFFKDDPAKPFAGMLANLPRVKGLVFGMFSEWSMDVEHLLKFTASKLAGRWAARNGLSPDEALQSCTWDLKRRWALTALRANAQVRIECAHHVKYSLAGSSTSQRATVSACQAHASWRTRPRT